MCFPRLNKCFCCFSLRTGMFLIIWCSLLWNIFFLVIGDDPPLILKFLDDEGQLNLNSKEKLAKFGQLYYATQMLIMSFALMGTFANKSCCLNLLVGSETVILLSYFLMTLIKVNRSIAKTASPVEDDAVAMFLCLGIKYYLYLVIISFYYEIMQGRDGQTQGGYVVSSNAFTAPPSAPCASDLPVETAHFLETSYPIQPPHAPTIAQPYPVVYAQNEHLFPHQVITQPQIYPFSPPPYPMPHPQISENPPPYAP